jgi:hypothetical protein
MRSDTFLPTFMLPYSVHFLLFINIPSLLLYRRKAQNTTLPLRSCHVVLFSIIDDVPCRAKKKENVFWAGSVRFHSG